MLTEGQITPIEELQIVVEPERHAFETDHQAAIAQHWRDEAAANPALFDGAMMLGCGLSFSRGRLVVRVRRVGFSAFLYWRRLGRPVEGVWHVFGCPLIVAHDGAIVAVRMAAHTANAGRIYCPSGSLDDADVVGKTCDISANMRREVLEETGLDLHAARAESHLHVLMMGTTLVIVGRYRLTATIESLTAAIEGHRARQIDPEIAGVVPIRGVDEIDGDFQSHMPAILGWHFAHDGVPAGAPEHRRPDLNDHGRAP